MGRVRLNARVLSLTSSLQESINGGRTLPAVTVGSVTIESDGGRLQGSDGKFGNRHRKIKHAETAFSQITATFPRHVHAVSFRGFRLKVSLFVIAFALDKAFIRQLGLIRPESARSHPWSALDRPSFILKSSRSG